MAKKAPATLKEQWKRIPDELEWDDVGGRLLANLARGIYDHPAVLREYVQNACDAYAVLPTPPVESSVTISVADRDLKIHDNGIGMNKDDIRNAKKIAVSPKSELEDVAGFRGIGVWAGFQACDKLEIITKRAGVDERYRLTVDFKSILSRVDENINIKTLVDPNYKIESDTKVTDEEHYTHVTLKNVHEEYQQLLDEEELFRIASRFLPCNIDPAFKHKEAVDKILDFVPGLHRVSILVQRSTGPSEAFRRFPAEPLDPPEKHILKDAKGKQLAVAWFCRTQKTALKSGEGIALRGFQLRIRNLAVGPMNIFDDEDGTHWGLKHHVQLRNIARLNWFCGEIHVTDASILPNTARNGVEIDTRGRALIEAVRGFYEELIQEAGALSEFNSHKRVLQDAQTLIRDWDSLEVAARDEQRAELLKKLGDTVTKVRRSASKPAAKTNEKLRSLLGQKEFKVPAKAALEKLKKLPSVPRGTGGSKAPKQQRKGKSAKPSGAASTDDEALLSEIVAVLENKLGEEHEDLPSIVKEVEKVIQRWSGALGAAE